MLKKIMFDLKPWQKLILRLMGAVAFCCATLGFMLCIAAFMITNVDTPEYILIPLTTVLLTFSSFIDSFLLAKSFKENGIKIGLFIGCIFTVIVISVSVYYKSFAVTDLFLSKVAAIFFAGVLGGILGVNT